jgi:hypothetical protein
MGRFSPTGVVAAERSAHSVMELPWGVIRGAFGPSDGSVGALSNVPSALSVLRHAPLYRAAPDEIEEAFDVLEQHSIRHRLLYPVAVTIAPFLFDIVMRGSPLAPRITDLLAEYAAAAGTLEPALDLRLTAILVDHAPQIIGWLETYPRAVAALAVHVPALRPDFLAALAEADRIAPEALLALAELGDVPAPGRTLSLALAMLDGADPLARMAAAAFLARRGGGTPDLLSRIDAALPPSAALDLGELVQRLWYPTVARPVVAPRFCMGQVLYCDARSVQVDAGGQRVTLPWADAPVRRGDTVTVGLTAHGVAKLVVVVDAAGSVCRVDF